MRVSIAIPVYNAEDYLDECIQSALNQTHADTEIVAVDDGSTDASGEILDGYADRISVSHKPNGGTASALNRASSMMSSDWFKWLSADDLLKPCAVEVLAGAAQRLGPRAARCIFYAEHDFIDGHGSPATRMHVSTDYNALTPFKRRVMLLDHFYGHGSTSMLHRSAFERCGGFDESMGFDEDYEFWLRCCLVHGYDMRYVDGNIASNRIHAQQLSSLVAAKEAMEKEVWLKEHVLAMLSRRERRRYRLALAWHQRGSLPIRARRRIRDAVLDRMSPAASSKLVSAYLGAKGALRPREQRGHVERNGLFDLVQAETGPADTVLDLGCGILHQTSCRRYGPSLPADGGFSMLECGGYLGCDLFDKYLDVVKRHIPTVRLDAAEAGERFRPYSYDVVIALDVVEHLDLAAARKLAVDMKAIARKSSIIFTPVTMDSNEGAIGDAWGFGRNEFQRHRCCLPPEWLEGEGYECVFPEPSRNTFAVWRRGPDDALPPDPDVRLP